MDAIEREPKLKEDTWIETACEEDPSYRPIFPYVLKVKIFSGDSKDVEERLQKFIDSKPMHISAIKQSAGRDYTLIITLFYYEEGAPRYIDKNMTYEAFASELMSHLEKRYDFDINDLISMWERKHKTKKSE